MPLIVHLSCGCKKTPAELILPTHAKGRKLICPEHPDATREKIIFRCDRCGNETEKSNSGKPIKNLSGVKRFCNACYRIRKLELNKRYSSTRDFRHLSCKDNKPTQNKWDCINYSECLMNVCRDGKCYTLPCRNCERYQRQELIDVYSGAVYGDSAYEVSFPDMRWAV